MSWYSIGEDYITWVGWHPYFGCWVVLPNRACACVNAQFEFIYGKPPLVDHDNTVWRFKTHQNVLKATARDPEIFKRSYVVP